MSKTMTFGKPTTLAWMLLAAALVFPHSYGTGTMLGSVLPAIGVTTMAETRPPKTTEYRSKLGPIPPEHFENEPRFNPNVDKSKGSTYDRLKEWISKNSGNKPAK